MPKDLIKDQVNIGEVVFEWSFDEYEKYERGRRWYLVMGLLAMALVVQAVWTGNYLFALVIVLFAIILVLQSFQTPLVVTFALSDAGVVIGTKFFPYAEMDNYWLVYNPPEVKTLYFQPNGLVRHRLAAPMPDELDPNVLREFLNQFLTEDLDREEEPLSDRLSRLWKLQ